MSHIQIDTTQNVTLEYEIAGIGDRLLAFLLDTLVKAGYSILILVLATQLINNKLGSYDDVYFILLTILVALPFMFYSLLFEIFMDGQTIGKRALKIKVASLDGSPVTIGSYVLRWLLRMIDINIFAGGIAILTILINGKGQRLGDLAAGTTVIKLKQRANLGDTLLMTLPLNYQATYYQVTQLNDSDMNVIKEVFEKCKKNNDSETISKLYTKVKNLLNAEHYISPTEFLNNITQKQLEFLDTVIKDYFFLTGK